MNTNIIGTLNPEHLKENVKATLRGPLSPKVYSEARRRLDSVGMKPA
jgi:hypothetical protein